MFFSNKVSSSSGPSKYTKCGYCSDFYLRGVSNSHNCFLRRSDSIFGNERKRSNTIHAQNVFYYDIESRLEERLECRFQETTESVNLHNLKEKLTERESKCMEVARCKSHQPTLLCVVNSMQSVKRHFCESECDNVITNLFSWIVTEILKPMNCRKDQKNDYIFVAHNGSAYDSQFIYKNAHDFFGSRNVQVLMHNNRMIELKIQVNRGFRMSAIYFKDSYKFINLPLRLLPKSFGFSNNLQKGFFPHNLNTIENVNYVSNTLPSVDDFGIKDMDVEEQNRFLPWYNEE